MKYFTPDLYLQFNSPIDEVADRADEAWEQALRDYRKDLDSQRSQLPPRVQELADSLCLHDAEVLVFQEVVSRKADMPFPFPASFPADIVSLQQEDRIVVIFYLLWDKVRKSRPRKDWPFATHPVYWLYDEVDVERFPPGLFWHRILFSDGRVTEIPFFDVIIHATPVRSPTAADSDSGLLA